MRKTLLTALGPVFAAATLAAAVPASAGEVTITVSYDGLDLTNVNDVLVMKDRIDTAVSKACGKRAIAEIYGKRAVDECVADGTAKALAALQDAADS